MKRNLKQVTALLLSVNMAFSCAGMSAMAEDTEDMSMIGTMAFAQCEEYINVRGGAGTDTEIVGKMGNHSAAMILDREGEWYKIKSGNVIGYVKAEYFAIGEEAQQIADEVAYCVAKVYSEALMVRTMPNEEADVVDMAVQNQELEVVQWDGGEWMTVALGNDVYGYVNAYYVDYNKYYAVAETLEEAASRHGYVEETADTTEDDGYTEENYDTSSDYEYIDESYDYPSDYDYTDESYDYVSDYEYTDESNDTSSDYDYVDESYDYVSDYDYTDESYDTSSDYEYTDESYDTSSDYEYTDESYDTSSDYDYVDESYDASSEYDYTDESYDTSADYDYDYTEETEYVEEDNYVTTSSVGQEIADFAVQFVGNPYVYGGTSLTSGADCSGFVQSVFASYGIWLPRVAADQAYGGTSVDLGSIQAGDLLFYSDGSGISHVALYIGGGQIVHASTPESGIIISNAYYSTPVCAARYWS